MAGISFSGAINEGDEVQIRGAQLSEDGILRTASVWNITRREPVISYQYSAWRDFLATVRGLMFLLVSVAIIFLVVVSVVSYKPTNHLTLNGRVIVILVIPLIILSLIWIKLFTLGGRRSVFGLFGAPSVKAHEVAVVRGEVRGFQERYERRGAANLIIWNFYIERHSPSGDRLSPVPIEIRAWRLTGRISNGDLVEVTATGWREGQKLYPSAVQNLTYGAKVGISK
jgi:hypothetical protein